MYGRIMMLLICIFIMPTASFADKIYGVIKDDEESTIGKVKLELYSGKNSIQQTNSDAKGNFTFVDVEPGIYNLVASKRGWIKWQQEITVHSKGSNQEQQINITMKLTALYKVLISIQFGSLVYIIIFGYLILVFNFFVTAYPTTPVTICGWFFIAFGIIAGFFKLKWQMALAMPLLALPIPIVITWWGNKTAAKKVAQVENSFRQVEQTQQQHQQQLTSLIGKKGITFSDLKPYGSASIEEKTIEVKALRGYIDKNTAVVVKSVEGNVVLVEED